MLTFSPPRLTSIIISLPVFTSKYVVNSLINNNIINTEEIKDTMMSFLKNRLISKIYISKMSFKIINKKTTILHIAPE